MANKLAADRNQKLLLELATKPGNDICADCKTRTPRWASHNLGIFICVTCASIHRKIGTHITKVKSLTMDTWTKEQVDRMKEMGNLNSNAIYCPNEVRHPPPPVLMEDERDSELEQYIRSKYEYKRFMDRSALAASKLGPSRSTSSVAPRSQSTPLDNFKAEPTPPPSKLPSSATPSAAPVVAPTRSVSQPIQSIPAAQPRHVSQPAPLTQQQLPPRQTSLAPSNTTEQAKGGVWDDLVSLQAPSTSSSLPLQYSQPPSFNMGMSAPSMMSPNGMNAPFGMNGLSNNPTGMPMGMNANPNMGGLGLQANPNAFQQAQFAQQFPQQQQPFGGLNPMFQQQQQQPPMFAHQPQQIVQSPQPMFAQQQQPQGQFMPGHSPQPMLSTTPQMMMSTTPQMPGGQFTMSPSPQLQQPQQFGGMGMNMGPNMAMGMGFPQQQQQQQPMFNQWGQQQQPFGGQQQWGAM
ncbi:Protein gts1 [Paramarasmius palmivorus]|uniref:Protein gts1 n=1 Tax=Paramarasmius palmivorus TaxID=297713 RepID=A0AAW0ECA4_9AGAR